MFRREGLTEMKADIAASDDSPSLRGMAHALVCMVEHADDELAQLTAENERLQRVVDAFHKLVDDADPKVQLVSENGSVDLICAYWLEDVGEELEIVAHSEDPDLFAQLKGADRG